MPLACNNKPNYNVKKDKTPQREARMKINPAPRIANLVP